MMSINNDSSLFKNLFVLLVILFFFLSLCALPVESATSRIRRDNRNRVWEGNGLRDFPAVGSPWKMYNWGFLDDSYQAWPFAHVTNPFCHHMLFQSTPWTIVVILFWESVEVFARVMRMEGSMFMGEKEIGTAEPETDSLLGDFMQGILGIVLAKLLILTYKIPDWTPSRNGQHSFYWYKRVLQYILLQPAFSICNASYKIPGYPVFRYGALVAACYLFVMFILFERWDWNGAEYCLFWAGRGEYARRDFNYIYTAMSFTACMLMVDSIDLQSAGYYQAWFTLLMMYLLHFAVLAWQDRTNELFERLFSYTPILERWKRLKYIDKDPIYQIPGLPNEYFYGEE